MILSSSVSYLCTVTELSILTVTGMHERYMQIFFEPTYEVFCILAALPGHSARHAHQQRKHAFFKVDVSQLYLFHLQTLEYYLEQSQRTLSLMNSSQRLCKKTHTHMRTHLHNMFDVPLQMMCYLLLCD